MSTNGTIDRATLLRLTSSRWLIPILAEMHRESGSRFGMLVRRLGLSRSMLAKSLDRLECEGWLLRNPGHGHPLRPEYLLTANGRAAAAWSERAIARREQLNLDTRSFGRWSLPLLFELRDSRRRFLDLARELRPITPRALSLAIVQLLDVSLVDRALAKNVPSYGLTDRGEDLAAIFQVAR